VTRRIDAPCVDEQSEPPRPRCTLRAESPPFTSPGQSPGFTAPEFLPSPERAEQPALKKTSIPHIPFIVFHPMLLEQCPQLILKRSLQVMLGLILNVSPHHVCLRFTHRERRIPALPVEIAIPRVFLLDPRRTRFLHLADDVRQRVIFGKREQDVKVILHRVGLQGRRLQILQHANHVCMEFVPLLIAN
jgi:hypothetical protein